MLPRHALTRLSLRSPPSRSRQSFSPRQFSVLSSSPSKYYQILGVTPDVDLMGLKKARDQLLKKNHPDVFQAKGFNVEIQTHKTAEINEAYNALKPLIMLTNSPSSSPPSSTTTTSPSTTTATSSFRTSSSSAAESLLDNLFNQLATSFPEVIPFVDSTIYVLRKLTPELSITEALEMSKMFLCFHQYRAILQNQKFFGLHLTEQGAPSPTFAELLKLSLNPLYQTVKNLRIMEDPSFSFSEKTRAYKEVQGVTWANKSMRLKEIWNARGKADDEDMSDFSDMVSRDTSFTREEREEFKKWKTYFSCKRKF